MADTIGTYYFQLAPSTEGIGDSISKALGEEGDKSSKSFGQKFTNGLATFGKVAAGTLAAAGAGIAKLGSDAVNAYADFEQLTGGITTLYEDLDYDVYEYAANAYKTAGLSMNEYMETAIGFAASLNNSLIESEGNIARSADLTDQIIVDMSDNVNKMGTTMESVQNAYRGFSRGNFTMLDNLALGFAGTKEGMQELLDKAQEISGVEYDISSFADIAEAIHVVQTDMGITGTTAREAAETISGSLSMVKSAWQNVITGMADENADFSGQIDALVESVGAFANNIIPRIEVAIKGVGQLITSLAPIIAEELPKIISEVAPDLLKAALSLIESLVNVFPQLAPIVIDIVKELSELLLQNLPTFVDTLAEIIVEVINSISDALPTLIPLLIEAILSVVDAIVNNLPTILNSLINLVSTIAQSLMNEGLPILLDMLPDIISEILTFIKGSTHLLIEAAVELVLSIVNALPSIIDMIVDVLPDLIIQLIDTLVSATPELINGTIKLVMGVIKALPTIITSIVNAIPDIISAIIVGLVSSIPDLVVGFVELFSAFVVAVPMIIEELIMLIPDIIMGLVEGFKEHGGEIAEAFKSIIPRILDGFTDSENTSIVFEKVGEFFRTIGTAIKEKFDAIVQSFREFFAPIVEFFSPILNALKYLFETIVEAIRIVLGRLFEKAKEIFDKLWNAIKTFMQPIIDFITPILEKIKSIVSQAFETLKKKVEEPLNKLKSIIRDVFDKIKDIIKEKIDAAKTWGSDLISNFVGGIKDNVSKVGEAITGVADKIKSIIGFSEPKEGPLSNFHTYAPDMLELFAEGITKNKDVVSNAMNDLGGTISGGMSSRQIASAGDSGIYGLLSEYLPYLAQGNNVNVSLEGNTGALFNLIRKADSEFRKQTGSSAFA